ncbi:hypothetical protein CSA37_00305 [Candidatus Fermentibacteria bacterium]|nr:MAG: hypothetical protein CSA37_00305 [Candidatus Fermentibacteria bacterium]
MTNKPGNIVAAAVIFFYPLFIILAFFSIFQLPFSSETVTRFITPFEFQGHANLSWAFMESTKWDIFRPVYSLSVLLDYKLWGTDSGMYHVTDLLLSWICYTVCFLLLRRRFGLLTASLAVLLWAAHPAQPLSLYKILGRNDRLVTLFTVTALYLYDLYLQNGKRRFLFYGLTLCSVVLAGLSKDTGIFYSLLLPLWSILAAKRTLRETIRSDLPLWTGIGTLSALFFLLRAKAGFEITADSPELCTGMAYVEGFSRLVRMSLPLKDHLFVPPLATFSIAAAVLAAAVFVRKLPDAIRFGAAGAAIFIFPFPFFWVQDTFMWGFTMWAALIPASILGAFFITARNRIVGRLIAVFTMAVIIGLSTAWARRYLEERAKYMTMHGQVADHAVSEIQGNSYPVEVLMNRFPEWAAEIDSESLEEREKTLFYINELVRIKTGNPEAALE